MKETGTRRERWAPNGLAVQVRRKVARGGVAVGDARIRGRGGAAARGEVKNRQHQQPQRRHWQQPRQRPAAAAGARAPLAAARRRGSGQRSRHDASLGGERGARRGNECTAPLVLNRVREAGEASGEALTHWQA